jgi:hypothetical protein
MCAAYLASQPRRACFCASCFACFAARFSFNVRLGFFGWLDGVDLVAMRSPYDFSGAAARSGRYALSGLLSDGDALVSRWSLESP